MCRIKKNSLPHKFIQHLIHNSIRVKLKLDAFFLTEDWSWGQAVGLEPGFVLGWRLWLGFELGFMLGICFRVRARNMARGRIRVRPI